MSNINEQSSKNFCLTEEVKRAVEKYLKTLNGEDPVDLYHIILESIEPPVLEAVIQYVQGNQRRAAEALGIHRNTLRKKLALYNLTPQNE